MENHPMRRVLKARSVKRLALVGLFETTQQLVTTLLGVVERNLHGLLARKGFLRFFHEDLAELHIEAEANATGVCRRRLYRTFSALARKLPPAP